LINYFESMQLGPIVASSDAMMAIANTIADIFNQSFSDADPKSLLGMFVTFYWGGAMIGRFIGSYLTRIFSPGKVLTFFALFAISMITTSILSEGLISMWSILAVGLFNSIMFPTIFTLSLDGLGNLKSQASGILCMAIVGGAVVPFIFGNIIDNFGFKVAFIFTILCYGYISFYGYYKFKSTKS